MDTQNAKGKGSVCLNGSSCFGIEFIPNLNNGPSYFQGTTLRQNLREGVIMGNQSLVLQRLSRNASGTYYCVATNTEGTAYSNPIKLDIKCEQPIKELARP